MADYEKAFLVRTVQLCRTGINFEDLAREALLAKFGGATDVLLGGLSQETLADPNLFVRAMSRMFGGGAIGIYEPIVKYIEMGLHGPRESSPVLDLIRLLGPPTDSLQQVEGVVLHDHRVEDEDGNYADDVD